MATLYIKEYQVMRHDDKGFLIGPGALLAQQKLAVTGSSVQSAAFDEKTRFVVLESDVPCQYETPASSPTADADSLFLSANNRILETVTEKSFKTAVISQQ